MTCRAGQWQNGAERPSAARDGDYPRWYLPSLPDQEESGVSTLHFSTYSSLSCVCCRTHVIASTLTPVKAIEFKQMRVASPEWIVESIKAGVLLPWRDFAVSLDSRLEFEQGQKVTQESMRTFTHPNNIASSSSSKPSPPRTPRSPPRTGFHGQEIEDPIFMTDPRTYEEAARVPMYALNKSNEAAQRMMSKAGWRDSNTAASGTKFIDRYYESSRLHHLSMWKTEIKELLIKAQEQAETGMIPSPMSSQTEKQMGHGVSMKGAELLKAWTVAAASPNRKGKAREQGGQRVVMHCDFDCFFASVGLIHRPELRDKPVVVCHSSGKGEGVASTSEVASCNYITRSFGAHNGMRYEFDFFNSRR